MIKLEKVNISSIEIGDTIIRRDQNKRTVGRSDIKRHPFTGVSIFGDTYRDRNYLVDRVLLLSGLRVRY